jgi:hypothetical protein
MDGIQPRAGPPKLGSPARWPIRENPDSAVLEIEIRVFRVESTVVLYLEYGRRRARGYHKTPPKEVKPP